MKTVLVTGAAGFIGYHASQCFLNAGYRVLGVDNFDDYYSPEIKQENVVWLSRFANFTFVQGDVLEASICAELFAHKPEIVVHLAGRGGVRPSVQDPATYFRLNTETTARLLSFCNDSRFEHFILASSSSVYGNQEKTPFSERDILGPMASPYAVSKRSAELLGETWCELTGKSFAAIRFFTAYGPRQRPEMAISLFAHKLMVNEPIPFFGDGRTRRDYTFVEDIARGILAVAERPNGFQIVNLGSGNPVTLSQLVEALEKCLQARAQFDFQTPPLGDVTQTYADITKAHAHYGWSPQVPLLGGLERTIAHWRSGHVV